MITDKKTVQEIINELPEWIDGECLPDDGEDLACWIRDLAYGGCESGQYMPAVTYCTAQQVMAMHGDDVLTFIEDCGCEVPVLTHGMGWDVYACKVLSAAVELYFTGIDEDDILTQDDIDEHNAEVFGAFFEKETEWAMQYVQSDDYVSMYAYLMKESDQLTRSVRKMLERRGWDDKVINADDVAREIYDRLTFDHDICDEYSSTHVGYLDSFQIGEYHSEIELSHIRESIDEDDIIGDLDEALRVYVDRNSDYSFNSSLDGKHPSVTLIIDTGLRVDWYIDDDTLGELLDEMLAEKWAKEDEESL